MQLPTKLQWQLTWIFYSFTGMLYTTWHPKTYEKKKKKVQKRHFMAEKGLADNLNNVHLSAVICISWEHYVAVLSERRHLAH